MPAPEPAEGTGSVPATPVEGLARYARTLRRLWPLAIAIVVVAALAGLLVAKLSPTSYDATAKVLLDQRKQVDALLGVSGYTPDPERELNTGVALIAVESIARQVRSSLGLRESAATLAGRVRADVDRSSSIASITARDVTPERAARIANAFALGYRDYRNRSARASVDEAIAAADARLRRLLPGPQRRELERELRRLQVAAAFQTGGVQIVRVAAPTSVTTQPRPVRSAIVGGFLGLVLAGLAIVVLARTDLRVGSARELEAATGRAVVAVVPGDVAGAREALITLAMSFCRRRRRDALGSTVLVTSPGPGEGTTDVALGLAHALGAIGRKAIAIEADLRTPAFAPQLGVTSSGGLAAILRDDSVLQRELVALRAPTEDGDASAWALPAGSPSAAPQRLLAGPRMAALVKEARQRADVVVLAGPPASTVGDSLALTGLVDSVLLVACPDVTRVDDLQRAIQALERMDSARTSIVLRARPPWDRVRRAVRFLRPAGQAWARSAPQTAAPPTGATSEATAG